MQKVFTHSGLAGPESTAFPWDGYKSSGAVVHLFHHKTICLTIKVKQKTATAVVMTVVPAGLGEMPQMQLH